MDLNELFETRRSYRRFIENRPVVKEAVTDMKRSLRLAPSAGNHQLLRYIFVSDRDLLEQLYPCIHWAAYLPEELGTPKKGERPSLLVMVLYDVDKSSRWLDTDAGIALCNMTLAAASHGVGSCIIGNAERDKIGKILGLDDNTALHTVAAFGYPAHRSTVTEMKSDGSVKYYLDENKDYYVPKRKEEDFITDR